MGTDMQYGAVFLRYPDIYEAVQVVLDIVGGGGPCCHTDYSYYRLKEPERIDEDTFRIDIPSNGGYYIAVEVKKMEDGVFQAVVLGSDYGAAGDQHTFGNCVVQNLKKRSSGGGFRLSFRRQ
jgi:hypothetical protein